MLHLQNIMSPIRMIRKVTSDNYFPAPRTSLSRSACTVPDLRLNLSLSKGFGTVFRCMGNPRTLAGPSARLCNANASVHVDARAEPRINV
jgi:hypothetical protein